MALFLLGSMSPGAAINWRIFFSGTDFASFSVIELHFTCVLSNFMSLAVHFTHCIVGLCLSLCYCVGDQQLREVETMRQIFLNNSDLCAKVNIDRRTRKSKCSQGSVEGVLFLVCISLPFSALLPCSPLVRPIALGFQWSGQPSPGHLFLGIEVHFTLMNADQICSYRTSEK